MKEPKTATTLADLGAVSTTVTIRRPDGQRVKVQLRALSEDEIWEIRKSITWPKAPVKDIRKVAGQIGEVLDYQDETYTRAMDEANRLQAQKMMLAGLVLDVPGDTEEARLSHLRKTIGAYAFNVLVKATRRINFNDAEEIGSLARSFRSDGDNGTSDNGETELDAKAVAGDEQG